MIGGSQWLVSPLMSCPSSSEAGSVVLVCCVTHRASEDASQGPRLRRGSSALHGGGAGPDTVTWFPPLLSTPPRLLPSLFTTPRVLTKEGDTNLLLRRFK